MNLQCFVLAAIIGLLAVNQISAYCSYCGDTGRDVCACSNIIRPPRVPLIEYVSPQLPCVRAQSVDLYTPCSCGACTRTYGVPLPPVRAPELFPCLKCFRKCLRNKVRNFRTCLYANRNNKCCTCA